MIPRDRLRMWFGGICIGFVLLILWWPGSAPFHAKPGIERQSPTQTTELPVLTRGLGSASPGTETPPANQEVSNLGVVNNSHPTLRDREGQQLTPDARVRVETELDQVQLAVRSFRTELGGIPIGTNAEITRELLGDNEKQVKVPIPPGSQLNGKGELCDRWGSPYFFHQLSRERMEIRSAGPDRAMWTDDDLEAK